MGSSAVQTDLVIRRPIEPVSRSFSIVLAPRDPLLPARPHPGQIRYFCGNCNHEVPDAAVPGVARCQVCARRLSIPTHVLVRCLRCRHVHRIRFEDLAVERLCAGCTNPLIVGGMTLRPLRRRRIRYELDRHAGSAHTSAAGIMLLMGLALILLISALVRL